MRNFLAIYLLFNLLCVNIPVKLFHAHEHKSDCTLEKTESFHPNIVFLDKNLIAPKQKHYHSEQEHCELIHFFLNNKVAHFFNSPSNFKFPNSCFKHLFIDENKQIKLFVYSIANKGSPLV